MPVWDRWDPFEELRRMQSRMGRMFREFEPPTFEGEMSPFIDVVDVDNELIVTADVPGVEKKDISIDVKGDMLEIRASRKEETEEKKKNYWRRERSYNRFYRTVRLPVPVDEKGAKATFKNGVLEIRLPKVKEERKKVIPIE